MKAKSSGWRFGHRSVISTVVVAGILLPFFFIRAAFLALDAGATICPAISCLGWRTRPLLFRGGGDTSLEFVKELRRVYVDADEKGEAMDPEFIEAAPGSLDHLLAEMAAAAASYQHVDIKTFLLKTKAMNDIEEVLFMRCAKDCGGGSPTNQVDQQKKCCSGARWTLNHVPNLT